MCGYVIEEKNIRHLRKTGVRDSKMMTAKQRESILPELEKLALDVSLSSISAQDIDRLRTKTNLNRIEIETMKAIIKITEPDMVIIDAIEANVDGFHRKIKTGLGFDCKIICENFADKNHPPVSAASVIAKVNRDKEIERLRQRYGFRGTGYSSDPATIKFLREWFSSNGSFPDFVRSSWITARTIKAEKEQKKLIEF
ncbi:MAG: ribonuclease HII [Candidatus Aenigmarchaeota archaeon]|nr:ribonuclease HII [Candidatus Aenigmarchaeota archaeon]